MGQKVNPHGARVGVIFDWNTRWFAEKKDFANYLIEDNKLRKFLKEMDYSKLGDVAEAGRNTATGANGISKIDIERSAKNMTVTMYVSKPGLIIGRSGAGMDNLKIVVEKFLGHPVNLRIVEIKLANADAQLVAENIAQQLEKRIAFRRAMKQSIQRAKEAGALGVKISIGGRVGGADIARTEHYHEGSIPLQTLRANIDYGFAEAKTTYGRLGIKVWVYKGQVLPKPKKTAQIAAATEGGN